MHFNNVRAEEEIIDSFEIAGWIWSDNYGWISLSSDNPLKDDSLAGPVEYGLKLDSPGNEITGWAWSENVGWVCFGSTCNQSNCSSNIPPLGDELKAEIDPNNKSITGWAMVVSMCDQGWIKLGLGDSVSPQVGVDCYDCKDIEVPTGENDSEGNPIMAEEYRCQTCFTTTKVDNKKIPDDYTGETAVGGSGNICFGCSDSSGDCRSVKYPDSDDLYRTECDTCAQCYQYGTAQASEEEGMVGWAWNGNGGAYSKDGAGWVNFSGRAGIVYPWLETIYGSIYTSGKIRQKSFFDYYNATYCLLAQDVFKFKSKECQSNYNQFSLSFPDEVGQSDLGLLDVVGLSTIVKTAGETKYNKYGNIIVSSSEIFTQESIILGNKVYFVDGDLTIDSNFKIDNGDSDEKGNGIVIVNGNLNINSSFDYGNFDSDLSLEQIASVAWVVKGDVIIGENVEKIVGAFLVLGNNDDCRYEGGASCNGADYPKYEKNGYGVFFSGKYNKPLTVLGLIVAKAFDFRRTYTSLLQGSERVIYDGRLLVNPPPGLKGFLENLPVIRD